MSGINKNDCSRTRSSKVIWLIEREDLKEINEHSIGMCQNFLISIKQSKGIAGRNRSTSADMAKISLTFFMYMRLV